MSKAYQLPTNPNAFSHDGRLRQRRPRFEQQAHLKFIRNLPCLVPGCSRRDVEAAHIRMASPLYGKRHTGGSEKPGDYWTVPLCAEHHDYQHRIGEDEFWRELKIDPFATALSLFRCTGNEDEAEVIIRARQWKQTA